MPESQKNEVFSQFSSFAAELGKLGYLKGGDGCGPRSFRLMNPNAEEADCLILLEKNDMVTGYFLIEVPNENEALKIARQCPAFSYGEMSCIFLWRIC